MPERRYWQPDVVEFVYGFERTLTTDDFDDYQWKMIELLLDHPALILGAFMGSGKTGCALYAAWKLIKAGAINKALVVAPLAVARDTWPEEILTWDFARELSYSVVVGSAEERLAALRQQADIHIVNRENYRWLLTTVGLRRWPWDLLIYDEISRLKGGKRRRPKTRNAEGRKESGRLSEFGVLVRSREKFSRVWGLTGTPASNGIIDLWGPVFLLDNGLRLGSTRTKFLNRWFYTNPYSHKSIPHDHSEGEILDRIKDVMYCFDENEYSDLPPLVKRDRWVDLEPKHMQMYRRFERTLLLDEFDIEAVNSGVLANKLLQFANGSVYSDEDDPEAPYDKKKRPKAEHVHDRKLHELESVFSESGGRSVLIAYSYRFDLYAIKKRFPWVRVYGETNHDVRDWNAGKLRAMVMHPASAGHGLNLQWGSNIMCWFGLNWSLELYQQFNKRLHRRGQEDRVWMYRILARGTKDGVVADALEEKGATQNRIVDAFRVSLKEAA